MITGTPILTQSVMQEVPMGVSEFVCNKNSIYSVFHTYIH